MRSRTRTNQRQKGATLVTQRRLPPWHLAGWRGPKVETRPEKTAPDWPENALERVVFRSADFSKLSPQLRSHLPLIVYFGPDGWPLHTPQVVKPFLDRRMQAEIRRFPWNTAAWTERTWRREARDFDVFVSHVKQASIIRGFLRSPIAPSTAQPGT
jgi:hypothetical protein